MTKPMEKWAKFDWPADEEMAIEVKHRLTAPMYKGQIPDIAAALGISRHIVFDIKRGRTWRHV